MKKRTKSLLLQLPAILLLIIAFIASIVVKIQNSFPISWGTPILLLIILVLYFWGRKLEKPSYPY